MCWCCCLRKKPEAAPLVEKRKPRLKKETLKPEPKPLPKPEPIVHEIPPASAFVEIEKELIRRPLATNVERKHSGVGQSQAFGIVNRRNLAPPDYSKNCWIRAYLYKLLIDYGKKYVKTKWNAITVNVNYKAEPHYDKGNIGVSYLVGFGDYTGGELCIHEGSMKGKYNIKYNPIVTDFKEVLHSVTSFEGNRYSLVYYYTNPTNRFGVNVDDLPPPSVRQLESGEWAFFRGDEHITQKKGLPIPHPSRGKPRPRKKPVLKENETS